MIDPLSISAIIISIIGAIALFIRRTHLSHCLCCKCIESDCKNPDTKSNDIEVPDIVISTPKINKKIISEV